MKALRPHTRKVLDVHLMIAPCDPYLEAFAKAGSDIITVHVEAGPHVHRTLQRVRSLGKRAGLVLNPGTPIDALDNVLDLVDLILIMTVNPGFGGQKFIRNSLKKISELANEREMRRLDFRIEVDGGVALDTIGDVVRAGADLLVAGNAVFGKGDIRENARKLLQTARSATAAHA